VGSVGNIVVNKALIDIDIDVMELLNLNSVRKLLASIHKTLANSHKTSAKIYNWYRISIHLNLLAFISLPSVEVVSKMSNRFWC